MHILLLGATGRIGGAIARAALSAGHQLTLILRSPEKVAERPRQVRIKGTIDAPDAWITHARGVDAVIHAACDWSGNMDNSEPGLIDTLARSGFSGRLVYTGGVWCFAPGAVTEATPRTVPENFDWSDRGWSQIQQLGMDAVWVHPGLVWGDGHAHYAPMDAAATARQPIPCLAPGDQLQPLIHADDLADGYLRALEHGQCGRDYLFVGENTPMRRIAEAVAMRHGLTVADVPGDPDDPYTWSQKVDCARALAELGWRPHNTDAARTLSNGAIE
ncbi:MAG: NAD-dependent epimerase/dehydratase family protein [Pseudomonadota bacterium]